MKQYRIVLFLLIVSLLVACTQKEDNDSAGTTSNNDSTSNEPIELKFAIWGNDEHAAMYDEVLQEFYKENENIKVIIELIPFADYQQKLSVLAAGNELPDIGWVSEAMVPQFVKNNILLDVSEFESDTDFNYKDIFASTLELWKHDGQLLGVPFSTPPMIIYYNKTMFEQAGLETPLALAKKDEWTWEKFEEVSKALSTGQGADRAYGAKLFREWTNFGTLPSHTISYGGAIFNDEMTKFTWNSPQGISTFAMLNRMMFEDKSHVPPGETLEFEGGKIGIYTAMYSYMSNARQITDFEWDIAPLPSGPNGSVPLLGQAGIVAFKGGDHEEEAKKLLKFLGSQTGIQAQSTFFVPPRKSVLESDEFMNVENNPPRESIEISVIDKMNDGYTYPQHENWTKIESEILNGLDKLYGQMDTPENILKDMEDNIQPLLK